MEGDQARDGATAAVLMTAADFPASPPWEGAPSGDARRFLAAATAMAVASTDGTDDLAVIVPRPGRAAILALVSFLVSFVIRAPK
jgi:hypothetical protein